MGHKVTVLNREGVASVVIDEANAPLVLNPETGAEERDWGNADWPSEEEVSAEISRQIGRQVAVKFFDVGDNLAEGIYHFAWACDKPGLSGPDADEDQEHDVCTQCGEIREIGTVCCGSTVGPEVE
jgi:hypothetical protein